MEDLLLSPADLNLLASLGSVPKYLKKNSVDYMYVVKVKLKKYLILESFLPVSKTMKDTKTNVIIPQKETISPKPLHNFKYTVKTAFGTNSIIHWYKEV